MNGLVAWLLRVRRWPIQLLSALGMNSYFLADPLKALPCWGLNCYACPAAAFSCPIGTLQHFVIVRQFPAYVLGVLGLAGSIAGRWSCGWLCPFGFLQDLLYRLKVPKLRLRTGWWGKLRYAVLALLVVVVAYVTLEPWFCKLCPQGALEGAIPQVLLHPELRESIGWFYWLKIAILAGFLGWMAVTKRPFCRFFCPLGAIWSPFNRISLVQLRVDLPSCRGCDRCREVCPTDISVYDDPNSDQCIRCLACVKACPHEVIRVEVGGRIMHRRDAEHAERRAG